jgi:HK97 family phage major capsid protein
MGRVEPVVHDDKTAEGLKKTVADIAARINVLAEREKEGFVSAEDHAKVDEELKALVARQSAIETAFKATGGPNGTGAGDERLLIQKAAMRLEVPEDMPGLDPTYFNLMALKPSELVSLAAAHMSDVPGLLPGVRRLADDPRKRATMDTLAEAQHLNDVLLVTDQLLAANRDSAYARLGSPAVRMKTLRMWPEYERIMGEIHRALNEGTTTAGGHLVPVVLSANLFDLVQEQLRVAALFPSLTMTSKTLEWPLLTADTVAYFVGESTSDTATKYPASEATFGKTTWTAKKFFVRTLASAELLEDSIIAVAPFLVGNIAKVLARAIEDALINGDTVRDMDLPQIATDSPKAAWHGLRRYPTMVASYLPFVSAGGAALTTDMIWDMKGHMKIYGNQPGRSAFIVNYHGLKSIMRLAEVITLDKFGPQATILNGQIASLVGSPVIVSEFVPETNNAANTGKTSATAANNTRGLVLYVHRDLWALGQRRAATVRGSTELYMETDQVVFVGSSRQDFQPFTVPTASANLHVGAVHSIL